MIKRNNHKSNLWNIIFFIYAIYYGLSFLSLSGDFITQGLVLIILIIGLISFTRSFGSFYRGPKVLFWTATFWVILSIAFILSPKIIYARALGDFITTLNPYKESTIFCLSLFIGYQIGWKSQLSQKQILGTTILLTTLSIISFLNNAFLKTGDISSESTTNNSAYTFLYIFQYIAILIAKYKRTALILTTIAFAFVVAGAKRGAIICMGLMIIYALIWYNKYYKINFKGFFGIIIIALFASLYIMHSYSENEYLQERMESTIEGNSSGRDYIYENLWEEWCQDTNIQTKIFGRGTSQTVPIVGNYAHSDWLELLIDNGLFGVFVYLMMFLSALRYLNKNRRIIDKFTYLSMNLWIILWLAKSIFSMGYLSMYAGISMMLFGYQLAKINRKRRGYNIITYAK